MDATATTAIPTIETARSARTRIDWVAATAFGLLWLALVARLRFEWDVNPQYGYGWTVPFLAAYVFWRRLRNVPDAERPLNVLIPAILIIAAAAVLVPVRLIQEANPDWRILSWTMAFAVIGISAAGLYIAGGLRWVRHFAFPTLFILVAVPWPTQFEQAVIQGLMRAVSSINVEVLNAIGISAVQMGNVIEVSSGFVGIAEACTGVRSLQSTFMVSLFLGEFYQFGWFRRIVLVIAGAILAFVCNLVRTFLLVWVAERDGIDAIHSWHDPAGLTILFACMFGLWGLSMLMGGSSSVTPSVASTHARGPLQISRVVLISLIALTVTAEAATQAWYGIHEARAAKVEPWDVAWPKEAKDWKEVPVTPEAQELLRYNEGGGGSWTGTDGKLWTMYFFKWLPGRTAGLFIKNHRPDVCLPASGMTLTSGPVNKLFEVNGVTLPIRAYVFASGATFLHVYYCYWDGSPPESAPQDQENWTAGGRMQAVKRGKRDVGTQMLEVVAQGYENEEQAERAVREQLAQIVKRG